MIYGHLNACTCSGACVIINVAEKLGQKDKALLIKTLGIMVTSLSAKYLLHNNNQKNKIKT